MGTWKLECLFYDDNTRHYSPCRVSLPGKFILQIDILFGSIKLLMEGLPCDFWKGAWTLDNNAITA